MIKVKIKIKLKMVRLSSNACWEFWACLPACVRACVQVADECAEFLSDCGEFSWNLFTTFTLFSSDYGKFVSHFWLRVARGSNSSGFTCWTVPEGRHDPNHTAQVRERGERTLVLVPMSVPTRSAREQRSPRQVVAPGERRPN